MHSGLCTRVSTLHVPKSPIGCAFWRLEGQEVTAKDWTATLENGPSPSALMGAITTVWGCLASTFEPRPRLRQGPPSGMVLLVVVVVVRLSQVTDASLGARDPNCHPHLRGLVSPQNVELPACTKGSIKQRMVQNAFGLMHKSLHTTCPKITHGVCILAPGGSGGHGRDWTATLENRPSPSALLGAITTVWGCLASTSEPRLRLRQGPPSGMVLLVVADVVRLSQITDAGLGAREPNCHPLRGLVSPQNVELPACTKGSIKQRMVQNAFGPMHKSLHTTCPEITHGVLILGPGDSRGHSKDWTVTLENGPSPSALMGTVATGGGPLPQPKAGLKSGGKDSPRAWALGGSRFRPHLTSHSCRPCRERHDLSTPSTGPSVSTKRAIVGMYKGLY